MGSGWHEWPLVLFTVLGQCVAGATIVSGLGWMSLTDNSEARQRLVKRMVFLWLMMGSVSWRRLCIWDRRSGHSTLFIALAPRRSVMKSPAAPVLRRRRLLVVAGEARQTACLPQPPLAAAEHAAGRHVCAGDDPGVPD